MIDHELMRIPTTKEPPMNHKKELLATTAAVAVATKPPAGHSPWSSSTAVSSLTRPATSLTHDGCVGAAASRSARNTYHHNTTRT